MIRNYWQLSRIDKLNWELRVATSALILAYPQCRVRKAKQILAACIVNRPHAHALKEGSDKSGKIGDFSELIVATTDVAA
jgi:hypothetical protein